MDQHQHARSAERASWFSDFDRKNMEKQGGKPIVWCFFCIYFVNAMIPQASNQLLQIKSS